MRGRKNFPTFVRYNRLNMDFIEALAHQMRGGAIVFFSVWLYAIYPIRGKNRMMRLLYYCTLLFVVGYLKDSIFMIPGTNESLFVSSAVSLADSIGIPVVCAFFLEASRPNSVRMSHVVMGVLFISLFVPVYIFFPYRAVIRVCYMCVYLMGLITITLVLRNTLKNRRLIEESYSYSDGINVRWVLAGSLLYFLLIVVYYILFPNFGWTGELIFILCTVFIWLFLYMWAKRFKVVPLHSEDEGAADSGESSDKDEENVNTNSIESIIAPKLNACMEKERLYLNPTLSLKEVSLAVGSNMKYLTIYLNHILGVTFYDYINKYRIKEACRLMEMMAQEERVNMAEVSRESGFNSISSFNRYFKKMLGITPKEYYNIQKRTITKLG